MGKKGMPKKKRQSGRHEKGKRTKANGYALKSGWAKGKFSYRTQKKAREEAH
jgi:hypothetical protein